MPHAAQSIAADHTEPPRRYPVITASGPADAGAVADLLAAHGAVQLDGCIDAALIEEIRAEADEIYRRVEASRDRLKKRTVKLADVSVRGRDAPSLLATPLLRDVAATVLGRPAAVHNNCYVRTILPAAGEWRLPFHQDQALLNIPLLNVWIAFTACGRDAPGLEVVLTDRSGLLPTSGPSDSGYAAERKQIDPAVVVETFGAEALWHPAFRPGDALLFLGTTIHRTHVTPTMTQPRTSVEIRLV